MLLCQQSAQVRKSSPDNIGCIAQAIDSGCRNVFCAGRQKGWLETLFSSVDFVVVLKVNELHHRVILFNYEDQNERLFDMYAVKSF